MKIIIRNRFTGDPIYTAKDVENIRQALTEAVGGGKSLSRANLSGANLYRANLYRANLSGADLSGADLYGASLYGADLSRANLYRADLSGADLSGANLYGANLYGADLSRADLSGAYLSGADLSGANLYGADLSGANLYGADLSRANLYRADLSGANLSGANLSRANLSGANLSRANLFRADGVNKYLTSPMYMLLEQVGEIRAYKLVTQDGHGPHYPTLTYTAGKTYTEPDFEADEHVACGPGINLASLDWCLREWEPGYRVLIASFKRKHGNDDNICVPICSDGKFRVRSCKIVGEVDLQKIGFLNENGERI